MNGKDLKTPDVRKLSSPELWFSILHYWYGKEKNSRIRIEDLQTERVGILRRLLFFHKFLVLSEVHVITGIRRVTQVDFG